MTGLLVLRAPNWVGDLVMATPVFAAALSSERWSSVRILVRAHLAPVLADAPWAERVVPLARDADETRVHRELAPAAVVLLSNSFGAALRAWRANVPMRAGAALSGRRFLLTHAVVPPALDGRRVPIPTAHLLRDVAALADGHAHGLHPRLFVRAERAEVERARLERLGVDRGRGYVLCSPGAAFGAAKLWPPERFAAALDALHAEHGWRGVVTGGPGEEPLMEAVARATKHGAVSLAKEARDLEGLKELVRGARLLLVGDSGPRWYAAAFDVPCVSVMGPNFPELTASALELARVVRVEGLECSPCLARVCPLGHHRCMRELGVESVVEAA
ncbi:MAG: glycosyltransferase family 9 protein, partial [Planctomycetes bacterium]|nr:glycosyltransferase family 9 protein [Planctomycetota bacterium]